MKALLPVIIATVGLAAVGAMVWILFFSDTNQTTSPGFEEAPALEEEEVIPSPATIDEDRSIRVREEIVADPVAGREKEVLLPDSDSPLFTAGLTLRIVHREGRSPVESEGLLLSVTLNDMPLSRTPESTDGPGLYTLTNLMPGRYKVEAVTEEWKKGTAACTVHSGESRELMVLVDHPRTLALRVVNAMTKDPVHNARIQSRGFVQGGLTDVEGYFTSSRKFTPDSGLTIQVTHPLFFSTSLDFSDLTSSSESEPIAIELTPLSGNLSLTGLVKDEEGHTLPRLSMFLSPADGHGVEDSITTYTNRSGTFRFDRLRPGTYRLSATLRFLVSPYIIDPPLMIDETVTLYPDTDIRDMVVICNMPKRPLTGRVLRADTLAPAAGAEVSYQKLSSGPSRGMESTGSTEDPFYFESVTTDGQGFFQTKRSFLPEEAYRLIVYGNIQVSTKDGLVSACRSRKSPESLRRLQADVLEGRHVTLWIVQQGDIQVSGRVLDASGVPLPGVRLTADSATDVAQGRVRSYTDDSGSFSIANLFPGQWVVTALIPKGPVIRRNLTVPDKGTIPELLIRIEHTGRLEGQIITDQAPSRWTIRVQGLEFETESQKIGSEYWYAFEHLPPGRARVILEVYEGRRYQENNLKVLESWVDLGKGATARKDFSF